MNLYNLLKDRILILDGAMGTMVQRFALQESDFRSERFANHPVLLKGNNDILVLTQPEIIKGIHEKYLLAGADIIETSSFNANRISQSEYKCEALCGEINRRAAQLAREMADKYSTPEKPRFVAGSVGPTSRTCSMSPDVENPAFRNVTFDELVAAYKEQMIAHAQKFRFLTDVKVIAQILPESCLIHVVYQILQQFAGTVGCHFVTDLNTGFAKKLPASLYRVEHKGKILHPERMLVVVTMEQIV